MAQTRMFAKGFTFIELVITLVILATLATLATTRFIDLQHEANLSRLKGMEAALRTGVDMVHIQAQLEGLTKGEQTITIKGAEIQLYDGYPIGHWNRAIRYVLNLDDIRFTNNNTVCEADWCGRGNQRRLPSRIDIGEGRGAKIFVKGYRWNDACGVYYINRLDGSTPLIGLETADC